MSTPYHLIIIKKVIQEEFSRDIQDLLTRPTGQKIMERLEKEIATSAEHSKIALDFTGVGVIDYSCADEFIAKLVSRLLANEYGDRYILLKNLSTTQRENIQVALERKNLAALEEDHSGWRIIGMINNYLQKTLEIVMEKGSMSSSELAEILKLELNNVSTRLINLHKIRLLKRISEVNGQRGKSHFVYRSIFS